MQYAFLIAGHASDTVREAFPELGFTDGPAGGTVVYGQVRDKSELRGMLARFDALGLGVIEMRQLPG